MKTAIRISWDRVDEKTYLFGARIQLQKQGVFYQNPGMASGKAIQTWRSHTAYWANRTTPNLPLLKGGHSYRLIADFDASPVGSVIPCLTFFDMAGEKISEVYLDGGGEFIYPLSAFSYELALINSSHEELYFRSFILSEKEEQAVFADLDYEEMSQAIMDRPKQLEVRKRRRLRNGKKER